MFSVVQKNGIPLYPNLVNLKSNTMKNTLQIYLVFLKPQIGRMIKECFLCFFVIEQCVCHIYLTIKRKFAVDMRLIAKNIKHFWSRVCRFRNRNGYGVHSPFAYNFIKGVVYERGCYYAYPELEKRRRKRSAALRGLSAKSDRLMFRIANYCRPGTVSLVGEKAAVTAEYIKAGSARAEVSVFPGAELEFVFASRGSDFLSVFHIAAQCAGDNAFYAAAGIHDCRESELRWKEICNDGRAVVTFDLYELGLVFFDKNLNRQNYTVSF